MVTPTDLWYGIDYPFLGRVDKRDSQTDLVLIQDCFLRSSQGSRGVHRHDIWHRLSIDRLEDCPRLLV